MKFKGPLDERAFQFALAILDFEAVLLEQKRFSMAKQLLRCGTSIGANIRESQQSESRADFIHKLKISIKEAEETDFFSLPVQGVFALSESRWAARTVGRNSADTQRKYCYLKTKSTIQKGTKRSMNIFLKEFR